MKRYSVVFILFLVLFCTGFLSAQTYVGSETCKICHNTVHPTLNYNIWEEYMKSGHPWKLNEVSGAPPVYPANTSPGVPNTPPGTNWNDFAYVIGGYGWKARFVLTNGLIFTADDSAQYNLANQGWVSYHFGETKPYNYGCFTCHTTAPDPNGSWNGVPSDSLGTFNEPGVRCEGCHGPGSDHTASLGQTPPPIQGDSLKFDRCGDCHTRGSKTNIIPASSGYIRHHEQYNEMKASEHGDGSGMDLTCSTCHDVHIPGRYPQAASPGLTAITTECSTCHPNKEIMITQGGNTYPKPIDCIDCHMPEASKSAIGTQVGNGWKGDVATHIWHINTNPVPKDSMFTPDGSQVRLDADGHAAVTLDFVCLSCHQNKTVAWAAGYADDIHTNGIVSVGDVVSTIPQKFELQQNFPNPFNPVTTIKYALPRTSRVTLTVYNLLGQKVAVLVDGVRPPGNHQVKFDARNLSSGLYIYTLKTTDHTFTRKMVLMK